MGIILLYDTMKTRRSLTLKTSFASIKRQVEQIRLASLEGYDPEAIHGEIDTLYETVLAETANGNKMAQKMAKEVCKIQKFNLTLWYA